jgi:hypothetical protein
MNTLILLVPMLVDGADKAPDPDDVTAGWLGFLVFILLALAVALLGFSLSRHLRKARDNADKGVFDSGDDPRPHTP